MKTVNLVFRKPVPHRHSIETVFNALLPYFSKEFELNRIVLPYETRGVTSMRKNLRFLKQFREKGISHITGHDHYMVRTGGDKTVLTIHDIGSALTGKRLRDSYIRYNWFRVPVSKATVITMISEFTANEFRDVFPYAHEKIRVIPNPIDDKIKKVPYTFDPDQPTILQVGTKENKNLERVAEALRDIPCKLTILGKLTHNQAELLKSNNIHYECQHHLPYIEVLALYASCDLVLYPSLYEGFGMPILEAQATGRPVVTSNLGVMPGTAGEGAILVNPYNVDEIRNGVLRVIMDEKFREDLIQKGFENANKYKAQKIAEQYMQLYHELAD